MNMDKFWTYLKQEACVHPDTAVTIVTLTRPVFKRAWDRYTLTEPVALPAPVKNMSDSMTDKQTIHALRQTLARCLRAVDNGSNCTDDASLEFLRVIPEEIQLVIRDLKKECLRRGQALVDIQDTPGPETSVRHLAKSCLAHSLTSGRIPRQNSPV